MKYLVLSAFVVAAVEARRITVINKCTQTIWPAMFTDLKNPANNGQTPGQPTGWEQQPGSTVQFDVPETWASGRLWGRTKCDFTKQGPTVQCETGGCNGGLLCDKHSGTGVPPATVAEWTMDGDGGSQDSFDVSLVDGFNLPMSVVPSASECEVGQCALDLVPNCPAPLRVPGGCKAACLVDPNPGNSPACCSGQFDLPSTCPSSGVPYYSYFKQCHDAYAYAYDDNMGGLKHCLSKYHTDYTVTFCPDGNAAPSQPSQPSPPPPPPSSGCSRQYTVVSGDNCFKLAQSWGVAESEIHTANPSINSGCSNLNIGQVLCVPGGDGSAPAPAPPSNGGCSQHYTVVSGDNCWAISQKFGTTTASIISKNSGVNSGCTNLQVGQSLCI